MARERLGTEIRQEQILDAVLDLVSAKGMAGLSVGAVARRVGLVPSALYRHFDSKDQIIEALLGLIENRFLGNVVAVTQEFDDPIAALEQLLRRHVELVRENAGIPRIIFSEEVYVGHPARKARVYSLLTRYLGRVSKLIEEAQRRGAVRSDFAAEDLAVMFLGLVQPAAILWHVSDGAYDVTRAADQAWRLFREAIRPE